jgi:hypothetical protein
MDEPHQRLVYFPYPSHWINQHNRCFHTEEFVSLAIPLSSYLLPTAHFYKFGYSVLARSGLRAFCSTTNMLYVPTLSLCCTVADALNYQVVDSLASSIDKISKSRLVHNLHRSTRVSNTVPQGTFVSGA